METLRHGSTATRACSILFASALLVSGAAACGGGSDNQPTPTQPTGKDSVSSVVGPSGGQVTTPSGQAGVQIPPGVLGQNVTVTVTRLPTPSSPGAGPLPTTLNQYGPYYEIQTSPANAQLGDSVRVGVCQVTDPSSPFYPPEATHDRLRLAHTVGTTTQILERVGVNDFLNCTGVTADAGDSNPNSSRLARALASLGRGAAGLFAPRALYAAHGGLGGKVKSFSPFGAVDPLTGLVIGPEFGIAATAAEEDFGGIAYDGTNYLVTTQARSAQGVQTISAQLVSPAGVLIGGQISIPAANGGGQGRVAFDGTNYLVVWSTLASDPGIRGQFISKSGALVGSSIIVVPAGAAAPSAIVFGGGTYFLAYVRVASPNGGDFQFTTFARLISPAGVISPQLGVTPGFTGDGFNNVAFDGTNFLTVYSDKTSVKGKFFSPAGVGATEKTIATGNFEGVVTVAFNGTNYLVTMASVQSSDDAVAQLVNTSGTVVGAPISIAAVPGGDELPVGTIVSGSDFIVSFVDSLSVAGKTAVKARFVSAAGATRGPAFTIASPAAGKVAIGFIAGFNGSKYFAVLLRGIPNPATPEDTSLWTQADILGEVVTAIIPPP